MQDLTLPTEADISNSDEAGIMLLTVRSELLLIMLDLVTRTSRTSAVALDAEHADHTGRISFATRQLAEGGREAWTTLAASPAFEELRLLRRNGSPRQTWQRFREQARQRFPGMHDAQLDVVTALAIRDSEVRGVVRSAPDRDGHERGSLPVILGVLA